MMPRDSSGLTLSRRGMEGPGGERDGNDEQQGLDGPARPAAASGRARNGTSAIATAKVTAVWLEGKLVPCAGSWRSTAPATTAYGRGRSAMDFAECTSSHAIPAATAPAATGMTLRFLATSPLITAPADGSDRAGRWPL